MLQPCATFVRWCQMELPKNKFKQALREGRQQIGIWNSISDPTVIEILAGCNFDWMMLDLEHSPIGASEAITYLRTLAPYPVSAIIRTSWNDPVEIKKLLDAGAQSLLIPYVQSAQEARAAVSAVTYPPKGIRGVSGVTRASRYGAVKNYAQHANEEICLLVQVETREALENIEAIANVEGIDGVFIGPADLAASLGYPGEPSHPDVKAAVIGGIAKLKALGMPVGFLSLDTEMLREVEKAGGQFIAIEIDSALIRKSALASRSKWA